MATPITNQSFDIYKGDTLLIDALYRSITGDPIDLVSGNITVESYLRSKDNRRFPITVEYLPAIGAYRLTADTSEWPLGRNTLLVRYNHDGVRRTAEPVIVHVEAS